MTRILIVGNSHVGALKLGWEQVRDNFPGAQVDFFAAQGSVFQQTRLDRTGTLALQKSHRDDEKCIRALKKLNGRTSVNLNDYDHVIRAGYSWYKDLVPDVLGQFSIDGIRETAASRRLTEAAFREICRSTSDTFAPSRRWTRLRNAKFWIVTVPVPAESYLTNPKEGMKSWTEAMSDGIPIGDALAVYFAEYTKMAERNGAGFIPQPESSYSPTGMTQDRYSRGSIKLTNGNLHGDADYTHMNADQGALMIHEIMKMTGVPAQTLETSR